MNESIKADADGIVSLRDWQRGRLKILRSAVFAPSRHAESVTLVAYSFPASVDGESFDWLECAIRQSWTVLGMLKTTIVVNRIFPKVSDFASANADWIDIQVEPSLVPGRIESMSADCDARLYSRFKTPYCLVVQDDGFPLRDSLDEFLWNFDYVGAPYVRIAWWRSLICAVLGMWVSNGGFSLRSKAICESAAHLWNRKYKHLHPCQKTVDDLYYTSTLPLHHLLYRLRFKIADHKSALRFSYDDIVEQPVSTLPMGFHRASTFETLQRRGLIGDLCDINVSHV
ncbi:MAG: hypothetical protein K6G91_09030 [Kiritimatiellae bacterium]|nr:hypothetical protein [Kiritimatiellia bacterium]